MDQRKIERIFNWFKLGKSLPFKIVIIPTNRCNLRCPYCPNALPRSKRIFKRKDELSLKEWKKVVQEGLKLGVKEWSIIGGGEPFLRKDVVLTAVRVVKKVPDTDCEIITNGTLIGKEDVLKLVDYGFDRILFSIDGPRAEVHDSLRGVKGTFERVIGNIKFFAQVKKKLKKERPYIKVNMVLNRMNLGEIEEMVKLVAKIGGQELALHPMREYYESHEVKLLHLSKEEEIRLREHVENSKKIAEMLGIFLNTDMLEMENKRSENSKAIRKKSKLIERIERCSCFEPLYTMLIDPNGFVNGCSPSGKGIRSLNVKEKSLLEIWFSKELSFLRRSVMEGKFFDYCLKCGLTDMKMHIREALLRGIE